jgi:hypothetical protein
MSPNLEEYKGNNIVDSSKSQDVSLSNLETEVHELELCNAVKPLQVAQGLLQQLKPFQILTLEEMFRILPTSIYFIASRLTALQHYLIKDSSAKTINDLPSDERLAYWQETFEKLRSIATEIGLRRTLERIERVDTRTIPFRNDSLLNELRELDLALMKDFGDYQFFYLPTENAKYFRQGNLFGVKDEFPEANKEIILAGNCYATGNYTACVFHLMRAVEIGAKAMVCAMKAQKHIGYYKNVAGVKTFVKKPIDCAIGKH